MLFPTERAQAESLKERFESLATRLQACIDPLERSNQQRPGLLEQLEQSRIFYSEQYREVHVVTQVSASCPCTVHVVCTLQRYISILIGLSSIHLQKICRASGLQDFRQEGVCREGAA